MECIIQTVMFRPFTGHDVAVSIVIAVLLGCSALVSGSETAFFSLTPRNIAQLKTGRSRSGRAILKLLSVQEYLLATILIVNNLVNICIVILSNGLIDSLTDFGGAAGLEFVVKTVVVTFLLLLFGEIMPKIFASYNPLRVARMTSIPLLLLKSVFRPLAYVLIRSGSYINESVAKKRVNISIDELSNAIEMTTDQTVEERRMLSGIVGFVHTEVVEIMKPRVDIVARSEGRFRRSPPRDHRVGLLADSGLRGRDRRRERRALRKGHAALYFARRRLRVAAPDPPRLFRA